MADLLTIKMSWRDLTKVDIGRTKVLQALGLRIIERTKRRVQVLGLDSDEHPISRRKIKVGKARAGWQPKSSNRRTDAQRDALPYPLLRQIKTRGGVWLRGRHPNAEIVEDNSRGTNVVFSRYATADDYFAANGGARENFTKSGRMWGDMRLTVKARKGQDGLVTVGFRGARPASLRDALRAKSAAARAYVCSSRKREGGLAWRGQDVPIWIDPTDSDLRDSLLPLLEEDVLQQILEAPLLVHVTGLGKAAKAAAAARGHV